MSFEDSRENKGERDKEDAAGMVKGKRKGIRQRKSVRGADVDAKDFQKSVSGEMT
jgi:hypothetical protein